jgi:hypothetical protein
VAPGGKERKLYEAGDFRMGQTTVAMDRDPGKVLGDNFLRTVSEVIAFVRTEVAKRKAAGQDDELVKMVNENDQRTQRALAALAKNVPDAKP